MCVMVTGTLQPGYDRASKEALMTASTLSDLYRPSHDEAAKQRFVGVLKGYANQTLEQQLAEHYARDLEPQFVAEHQRAPANRSEARPLFEADPLYQVWGSMVHASQSLMWQSVGETCRRIGPAFEARAQTVTQKPRGSLQLDPSLELPQPIASTEIHRQPGGYYHSEHDHDLHAALIYFGTLELYRAAKGLTAHAPVGEPGIGRYIASVVRKRYADLKPRRILDLGCGPGTDTIAYKEAFPDAEVHGLDEVPTGRGRASSVWVSLLAVPVHDKRAVGR